MTKTTRFLLLAICLFLSTGRLSAQNQAPYFEQNGSDIFIEAEDGGSYGWLEIPVSNASGGSVFFCPVTDTLGFIVSEDTYIDVHNPEINYGSSPQLLVKGKGGRTRGYFWTDWGGEAYEKASYVKFEITSVTGLIVQARVFLYCEQSGYGGGIFILDPLRDDLNWNEFQATWNNRPSKGATAGTFQCYMGEVHTGNWYTLDVTQGLYKKGDGIYSFGLVMQENQQAAWSSKEGSYPPYLEVEVLRVFSVSGNVLYYANDSPIGEVALLTFGAYSASETTGVDGYYEHANLMGSQSYYMTASKPPDSDVEEFTILTYDAALTAQAAVGLRQLTDHQVIAADVNRDGKIYTYDAALIARYAVGLPKLPSSHVGEWVFVPDSIRYEPLDSDETDQNFVGILLGDVHGEWGFPEGLPRKEIKVYTQLKDMAALPGERIVIPLFIEENQGVISCDIAFRYDPKVLKFVETTKIELTQGFDLVHNANKGKLRVGLYGVNPINEAGGLVKLIFEVIGKPGQSTPLSLDRYQINNGLIRQAVAVFRVTGENELPKSFSLEQNYPNPFNLETVMKYQIPKPGEIVVKIFDLLGQEVKTLVHETKEAGYYRIIWNGKDKMDKEVPSGIYLCRAQFSKYVQTCKIIKLR